MKWSEVVKTVTRKLGGAIEKGTRHDFGHVRCGDQYIGKVEIGRHTEMKSREIGNCGRSLRLNEHQFKQLVSCSLSAEEYCELMAQR